MHHGDPMRVIIVFGPPLPGRDRLVRALEATLPAGARVIAGDFATVAEREALFRALALAGARPVFVAWACDPAEAQREIYHHYPAMPRRYADLRWRAYRGDAARREPPGDEVSPTIVVEAGAPIEPAVADVVTLAGAGEPAPAPPAQVLVVEDDPDQLALLCDALSLLGCEPHGVRSAGEALSESRARRFDLVVADHRLPDATGTELAARLAHTQPGVRVAIVTAHPDHALDELGPGRAVGVVLAKPIGIADLIHLVEEVAAPATGAVRPH
jgi:CheY-like chemotaxis protein